MSRKRPLIMALALATTSASLLAVAAAQAQPAAAVSAACPWVGSSAPIPQRVGEVMSKITQAQEIDRALDLEDMRRDVSADGSDPPPTNRPWWEVDPGPLADRASRYGWRDDT